MRNIIQAVIATANARSKSSNDIKMASRRANFAWQRDRSAATDEANSQYNMLVASRYMNH